VLGAATFVIQDEPERCDLDWRIRRLDTRSARGHGPASAEGEPILGVREAAMIERILVPGVMAPVSHYCHVVRAGPHVWVSGVVGMDGDGNVPDDVVAQFDLAIGVMDQCLRAAGAGAEHVVKVQVFMIDINERPAINPRRIAYFGDHRPASTLVEVSALVDRRLKVEIECQAYIPSAAG
jgi:enamine deaminase RidA (YjgF/YER057c/UK114 family)